VVGKDVCFKRRSIGVKKPVTGDLKTIMKMTIIIIIIIISPKSWYRYTIRKKERKRSGLLQNEATYEAEIIENCRISEHKIYRRPVCEYC
jgi:hypothetical protein